MQEDQQGLLPLGNANVSKYSLFDIFQSYLFTAAKLKSPQATSIQTPNWTNLLAYKFRFPQI